MGADAATHTIRIARAPPFMLRVSFPRKLAKWASLLLRQRHNPARGNRRKCLLYINLSSSTAATFSLPHDFPQRHPPQ